ncbi:hypothetical protein FIBSPDRAFT_68188 [Athelia psychrophila]|uniref:Uncharacterized protein n=1 Tax=Athelia psychrophila TaxID=1759441 RepID=A0A166EQ37_9AGAM|nr:hypothetical protein FIBSPDRAFT_68188 [Fibularhizoctonia sp. CBS 109695]
MGRATFGRSGSEAYTAASDVTDTAHNRPVPRLAHPPPPPPPRPAPSLPLWNGSGSSTNGRADPDPPLPRPWAKLTLLLPSSFPVSSASSSALVLKVRVYGWPESISRDISGVLSQPRYLGSSLPKGARSAEAFSRTYALESDSGTQHAIPTNETAGRDTHAQHRYPSRCAASPPPRPARRTRPPLRGARPFLIMSPITSLGIAGMGNMGVNMGMGNVGANMEGGRCSVLSLYWNYFLLLGSELELRLVSISVIDIMMMVMSINAMQCKGCTHKLSRFHPFDRSDLGNHYNMWHTT